MTARNIIESLAMLPHPEGGYYKETYRHPQVITLENGKKRNLTTTIYYLLEGGDRSHFHRLCSDETWFFHSGQCIELIMLQDGKMITQLVGNRISEGETPQLLIPANTWFGAQLLQDEGYGLVSCTVSPGFDLADFELATEKQLLSEGYAVTDAYKPFIR